uniref:uncharacterized protein LOC109974267 n=1 Tax=Monopterus albus TaxID=43700 RepID=UPI0009B40FFF|nr:uncharacterized protein LOC109974267 [Monopterus albus]
MRQRSTQRASMRKHCGPRWAPARTSMTTEYQDRFLPPCCHMAVISTAKQKNPYHPLKGTSSDIATYRSYFVTKLVKNPPKAPQPPVAPRAQRQCSSAPHMQLKLRVEDYTSVYKHDFRAWKTNMDRLSDSFNVNQGSVITDSPSQKGAAEVEVTSPPALQRPRVFESMTSYRADYVAHPVQPRTSRDKPVHRDNIALLTEPAASFTPKMAWDINQERTDGASEFFKHFKTQSPETKFHGQGKARVFSPAADHTEFISTTHADFTPLKWQRTEPILPSMQISQSKEPFHATTTMREAYKDWNTLRQLPAVHKEDMAWPWKSPVSACTAAAAESCKTTNKPLRPDPKMTEAAVCNSRCNASWMHQSTSADKGVTRSDGDDGEEPSQTHQIISYMI